MLIDSPQGPLCAAVTAMLEAHPAPSGTAGSAVARVAASLNQPLRVAVLGRVNTGKSTLVNAMLGRRVAATGNRESTRVVTWYRYGHLEHAELRMKDGSRRALPLQGGGLPDVLEVDPGSVESMAVTLSNELLRTFTLIDTPGLGSIEAEVKRASRDFLMDASAPMGPVTVADAVLFVVRDAVTEDERDALQKLHARKRGGLAVSTIGVLTRVDQFCDPARLMDDAEAVAADRASDLREYLNGVVPLLGLLAETAEAGLLRESDMDDIATLTGLPAERREAVLGRADTLRGAAQSLGLKSVSRLIEHLDMYGVREGVRLYSDGHRSAAALTADFARSSGIQRLRIKLHEEIASNADALRASWALSALEDLSFSDPGEAIDYLEALRDDVEELRESGVMHRLIELKARHEVLSAAVLLPEPQLSEFLRVTGGGSIAERLAAGNSDDLRDLARKGVKRWREFGAAGVSPDQGKIVRIAIRSYTLARAAATETPPT